MGWSPEAARERDLHRYYQPWLDAQEITAVEEYGLKGLASVGHRPKSSRDKALTAFAQLAALRLDTRRAMVSLIDSSRQYILAEATKTLSLNTPKAENPEDAMWLGNAIMTRNDAVCHYALTSTYKACEENGEEYEAECMVVPDCRLDPRFSDRSYVVDEPGVRFYAGVPITTRAGYKIGVYAVSDDLPRQSLTASEVRFMQDVAAAVMEHLELAKDSDDRLKGERMVRGLTQFIERTSLQNPEESTHHRQTTMEKQTENARIDALDEDTPHAEVLAANKQAGRKHDAAKISDASRIFQRAARIIRHSTNADGVVIFDTSAAGIKARSPAEFDAERNSDESTAYTTTDLEAGESTLSRKRTKKGKKEKHDAAVNASVTFGDGDLQMAADLLTIGGRKSCPITGFALREGSIAPNEAEFAFTESGMERYIVRYPYGKYFSFNEDGVGVNSSDERSERSETENSDHPINASSGVAAKKERRRKEKFVPSEFLKTLPNIRSLLFLPLWDAASERWIAGGFIWTTTPGRLMSPENELPYLQAFGHCITSEVARLSAQKSDRAKSTFIASISHELRSPLHGILGSVEFLRETITSGYQDSLVASIQTCGRTLLDTIDHVLDYAKINKLRTTTRPKHHGEGRQKRPGENSTLGVTADFDLAQLVEEVCDTVCAGHSFRKTRSAHDTTFYDQGEDIQLKQANSDRAEQDGGTDQQAYLADQGGVAVSLIIEPFVNWVVHSQPGALRRIVMNLLGNALKYTPSGFIAISLLQQGTADQFVEFGLVIEDTGKGMSTDFQKTKLFTPFSQEDPFSSGTGLGLSIVKQIVESLNGEIEVKSTVDVGTEIKVTLRLMNGQSNKALMHTPEDLEGKSASIIIASENESGSRGEKIRQSLRQACQGFEIKISEDSKASLAEADFLLTDTASVDRMLFKEQERSSGKEALGVVCICVDATEKTVLESRINPNVQALGWNLEILAQPCGPRKLARVLLHCLRRAASSNRKRDPVLPTRSLSTADAEQAGSNDNKFQLQRSVTDRPRQDSLALTDAGASYTPDLPTAPRSFLSYHSQPSPGPSDPGEYFNPRVLLVDDNAINRKLLVVFAKRQNLPYSEAANGLEAFEIFEKEALSGPNPTKPFDFVLMDLSMPIMDGLESTRRIRQLETTNQIPRTTIVALTGLASGQDQEDATDAGMDMYLVKPVKFADIKRILGTK